MDASEPVTPKVEDRMTTFAMGPFVEGKPGGEFHGENGHVHTVAIAIIGEYFVPHKTDIKMGKVAKGPMAEVDVTIIAGKTKHFLKQ